MNAKQLAAAQAFDVKAATGPELVAAYNKLTGQNIKKFADRKTAEKRWAEALAAAVAAREEKAAAQGAKAPKAKKEATEPVDRSAAIAASWADPEVRAKRAERTHVKVNGVEYPSVRQAFQALGLPDSKHIKFRMELKSAGKLAFEGKTFITVAASPAEKPAKKTAKKADKKAE